MQTTKSRGTAHRAPRIFTPSPATAKVQTPASEAPVLSQRARHLTPSVLIALARIAECILLCGTGAAIAIAYVPSQDRTFASPYFLAIVLSGLLASSTFKYLRLYSIPAFIDLPSHMVRVLLGWAITFAGLIGAVFFLKIAPDISRAWLGLWFVLGVVELMVFRLALTAFTRRGIRSGRLARRAVVYGAGPSCEALIAAMKADPTSDVRIDGIFDDRCGTRVPSHIAEHPRLGKLNDLIAFGRANPIDVLIVALPLAAETRLNQILRRLWVLPVDIRIAASASQLRFRPRAYSYIGSVPLLDVQDKPINDLGSIAKWLFDKIVASAAIIALAPLMLATAAAIKLDSRGPVLFRQKRYGFNNEMIEIFKFRSMYQSTSDPLATTLVTKNDPRVTRVGRIIRKASIDELPQLFNVLLGQLSLVGPRPHALQAKAADRYYHDVVDGYFARHKVRPGITGWAQINGWRGETDTPEKIRKRVEFDLYYIDNWSVFFDAYILLLTPMALLKAENAY